jgi:membrane protein implicated in regulation of membrane protease activity
MSMPERADGPGAPRDTVHDEVDHDTVPPANTGLLVVAGVLLLIPIVALMWVGSYNRDEPRLGAFPFFIWYQFLWVFLCSAMTYTAYRLVLKARPHRPMTREDPVGGTGTDREVRS